MKKIEPIRPFSKHKLLVEYETGDVNDTHALGPMALKTKELLKVDSCNPGTHYGTEEVLFAF